MSDQVHCFTSFTFAYLAKARVLAWTLKRHNPDWKLWALITDREPPGFEFDLDNEDFDGVAYADELGLPGCNAWIFKHDVVEACTAVKGLFLTKLLDQGAEKVVYLDPDIAIFSPLTQVEQWLDESKILLTPHQLAPDTKRFAIVDNEICSLKHGTFNLGFLGIRNDGEGRTCAEWWRDRLLEFCFNDIPNGLFTDQRWCDLLPSFFSSYHVIRDPGFNVASWNLSQRRIEIDFAGDILVNGSRLKFYHFTKLGPTAEVMTARYGGDNIAIYELWSWYEHTVEEFTTPGINKEWWHYGTFENGQPIPREARHLYRNRTDLQEAFPQPFRTGESTYHQWLLTNGQIGSQGA